MAKRSSLSDPIISEEGKGLLRCYERENLIQIFNRIGLRKRSDIQGSPNRCHLKLVPLKQVFVLKHISFSWRKHDHFYK